MQALKRNLTLALLFLLPLIGVVGVFVRWQVNVVQERRDHNLRAALKSDDLRGVERALAEGANPNCREVFRDKRSLWDRLRFWNHPAPPAPDAEPPRAALVIALDRALNDIPAASEDTRYAILKALHDAGAVANGDAPQFQNGTSMPPSPEQAEINAGRQDDLTPYLKSDCMITDACVERAKYFQEKGWYATAAGYYRIAQLWRPDDANIHSGLAKAQQWDAAANAINQTRKDKNVVIKLCPFPDAQGRRLWIALPGVEVYTNDSCRAVALYEERNGAFHLLNELAQSFALIQEFSVRRVTGRAAPEIVIQQAADPDDAHSACITLFEIRSGRLRPILDIEGDSALKDLRHDGHLEAVSDYGCVSDYQNNNADLPCRADVYAYNGDKFALADREFPEGVHKYIAEAKAYLAKPAKARNASDADADSPNYENDKIEVWYYLGNSYAVLGQTRQAERCYQKAEQLCRAAVALALSTRDYDSDYEKALLKHILARDARLFP